MCKNNRLIINPYTGKKVLAPCRTCPDCLQMRANRNTQRIRNYAHFQSRGQVPYFITLTYDNENIPYIHYPTLSEYFYTVYRGNYNPKIVKSYELLKKTDKPLDFTPCKSTPTYLRNIRHHNYYSSAVGILYYPDIQRFLKRFRSSLKYHGYDEKVKFFCAGEYGGKFKRPHFHLLLYVSNKVPYEKVKSTVVSSWSFCDYGKLCSKPYSQTWFQIAKDVAAYISSYVNNLAEVPELLRHKRFKPCYHFSSNFGNSLSFSDDVEFDIIRKAVADANFEIPLTFYCKEFSFTNIIPIPSYIKSKYFPKFKGMWKLSYSDIAAYLFCNIQPVCPAKQTKTLACHKQFVSLINRAYSRFAKRGFSIEQYVSFYIQYIKSYFKYQMKCNIRSPSDYALSLDLSIPLNYNDNSLVNRLHSQLSEKFYSLKHKRQLNSKIYGRY